MKNDNTYEKKLVWGLPSEYEIEPFTSLLEEESIYLVKVTNMEELEREIDDADAVFVHGYFYTITEEILDRAKKLKVLGRTGSALWHADAQAAKDRGILVFNQPGDSLIPLTEATFTFILALFKDLSYLQKQMKDYTAGKKPVLRRPVLELYDKTLGIIGLGRIGYKVSKLANEFGMNVIAYDPYVKKEIFDKAGAIMVDLNTLLKESDVVTLHSALTEETYHSIEKKEFELMKKTAFFIDTSQGGIVNEDDLYDILLQRKIAGAAKDVWESEMYDKPPINNPLYKLDNIICTPHRMGISKERVKRRVEQGLIGIISLLKGEIPVYDRDSSILPLVLPNIPENIKFKWNVLGKIKEKQKK